MDRAVKADVDLAAPVLGLGVGETLANGRSGIVDQDIEAAEIFRDLVDHGFDRGEIGDVAAVSLGLAARSGNLVHDALLPHRRTFGS